MRIGLIGTGIMGKPMGMNLVKAGYALNVYNRTKEKTKELVDAGANLCESPKEVAEKSDVIITIVSDSPDVEQVVLGENGISSAAPRGQIVIDMSTISAKITRKIAQKLEEIGMEMLDAPVSGGDVGAKNATLTIMVGGKKEMFEKCKPVFEALGRTITYFGDHGMGQLVKQCNQIVISVTTLAVAEALSFAKKAGLDQKAVIGALSGGSAKSWILENGGPKMVDKDYKPGFMIKLLRKDLNLVMESAKELKIPLPATSVVLQLYNSIAADGGDELSTFALAKVFEKLEDA